MESKRPFLNLDLKLGHLFVEFFKISLFVIGGGYSILVVADRIFTRKGYLKEDELIEQLPIFQMIPGLIATHTAVYVGLRVAGVMGACVSVVAVALPSLVIFTGVAIGYAGLPLDNPWLNSAFVGLRAALTGIIVATVIRTWRKFMNDAFAYALWAAGVVALSILHVPVWAVLVASMICGLITTSPPSPTTHHLSIAWLPILAFFKYGALCFGGGFVLVPMYIEDFVGPAAPYLQLASEEFSNIMAVSQMTPGPIGVNGATFFGYRLAGVAGAVVATFLLLLPGSLLAGLVFRSLERFKSNRWVKGLFRGIRPASIALMCVALVAFARMTLWDAAENFHIWGAILVILITILSMNKKINVIILIVLCACAACVLRAEEVSAEQFPDADVVALCETENVEYKPDGSSVDISEAWSKILTERGRREESELRLGYNLRYGSAKILYVGAIDSNGVERAIDVSGTTKEMTDNSSLEENIVDPMDRELVCTIPGLKVGETVHVKAERSIFKSRIKDQWSDLAIMEWTHPILKSVYTVRAPKERPIKSRAIRHPLGNVTEEIKPQPDGSTLYVYTATNSPRMFPEPDMPPQWNVVQSVHLSTASDWREISRWYWSVCLPHLEKTNAAITNKVEELGRDMRAIFKFVSQDIRYMGLTMEDTAPGYAPHDVDITFDNRYGVCRDKGALLVAMLRIAGYKAYPVLINVGAKMDPDVPKPYFNHAIVAVEEEGGYQLLDPTCENTKDMCPGYLCNCSYLVARPEGEALQTSPVPPPERNKMDVVTRGELRGDGTVVLKCDLSFAGINDTIYRGALVRATPEKRIKFVEKRIKSIQPGAELIRCDITPEDLQDTSVPLHVTLTAKLPETVLRGTTEDAFAVPFVSRAFSIAPWLIGENTSLEKRRYPLMLDTTACASERVEIQFGDALGDIKNLPESVVLTNGFFFSRRFDVVNGRLTAFRTNAINRVEFSPADYAHLRDDMKRVEAVERHNPTFVADAMRNANIKWILESTDIDIASDTAWTERKTLIQEVLTYRGKKDAAEVTFPYNPTWGRVEILSATVSNVNGVVSHVKPTEMNEVDAAWAAAAPRYPAGKTLIVNLPAVEIGSVISLTTLITVTNAPAPFYGVFGFDSKEPLLRRHLRVDDWTCDVASPRRIPDEPNQPAAVHWRNVKTISKCSFEAMAELLRVAADVDAVDPAILNLPATTDRLQQIRDWMSMHVRLAGPSLYEVPILQQLTEPQVVIEERYATRLDYIRTLCALLRGAGYDADIVFATRNASLSEEARRRDITAYPNVRAFAYAICRVREHTGGFWGFFDDTTTYYIGTENEYTPLTESAFADCDYFDPEDETFERIPARTAPVEATKVEIDLAHDGSARYHYESRLWGAAVGGFRKHYAEILPEDLNRHYQKLLATISKAAQATSPLKTDITHYPAQLCFTCSVPDYATVEGDTMTLKLSALSCPLPTLPGEVRRTPIGLGAQDASDETVVVRFPKGYTEIESLPEGFVFCEPLANGIWIMNNVTTEVGRDDVLTVRISRFVTKHPSVRFGAEYAELFREWRRRATSQASRTIVVKKVTKNK